MKNIEINSDYVLPSLIASSLMFVPALASALVLSFTLEYIFLVDGVQHSLQKIGFWHGTGIFIKISILGMFVSAPITVIYGGGIYFILKKKKILNLVTLLAGAAIPSVVVAITFNSIVHTFFVLYLCFIQTGYFWWLVRQY